MTFQFRRSLFLCLALICILINPRVISGQLMGGSESSRIDGKFKFMPVPYLNYDRSLDLISPSIEGTIHTIHGVATIQI